MGLAVHWEEFESLFKLHPRSLVVRAISDTADAFRQMILAGQMEPYAKEKFVQGVMEACAKLAQSRLRKVINASGIIVHTNLGRSVLAPEAIEAVVAAASGYSTLEYDLEQQKRGSRHALVSKLLCEITGAKAAIAVNNNAGAVLLALNTMAEGRSVVVSRGELVEIGGSFRIPDVMKKGGCRLVEVGATNKTHPADYRGAVTNDTALFLKVHMSNYRILGFTTGVSGSELVDIGAEYSIPVMEDLGSGFLTNPDLAILRDEPTVQQVVESGVQIITFSGDKLLGGPQAGIILGEPELIERISKNPLARALRCDKMTLAALEATLLLYRDPQGAIQRIPTLRMAAGSLKVLREKARRLATAIREKAGKNVKTSVVTTQAQVGGGALPLLDLPSAAVALTPGRMTVNELDRALHQRQIPIIGRIEHDRYLLDVRTLLDGDAKIIQNALVDVLNRGEGK